MLFAAYAAKHGVALDMVSWSLDDTPLQKTETPATVSAAVCDGDHVSAADIELLPLVVDATCAAIGRGGERSITIQLRRGDGGAGGASKGTSSVHVKILYAQPMRKLFAHLMKSHGVEADNIRLMFDGERLTSASVPEELDMEDDDMVDMVIL